MTKREHSEPFSARRNLFAVRLIIWVVLSFVPGTILVVHSQTVPADVEWLEEGKPIERELPGGQSHTYQLKLSEGQYARVLVRQKSLDVVVKIYAPDGKLITEVDDPIGTQGTEPVHITAEATGSYRIEITALDKTAPKGRYEAKLVELRNATQQDRDRLAADRTADEGTALIKLGTPAALKAAIKKFEEALPVYRAINDPSEQFTVLLTLGYLNMFAGEHQKALEAMTQASQAAQALGDKYRHGWALQVAAEVYQTQGEFEKALLFGDEALRLYQAAGENTKELEMLRRVGNLYSLLGENEKARAYFERVIRLYQTLGYKNGEAATLYLLGYSHHLENEFPKALEYWNEALVITQLTGNKKLEAALHAQLSNEYARAGERQQALAHIEQALKLRTAENATESPVLGGVGSAYYRLGEFAKALDYLNESLRIHQASGSKRDEALSFKHIAAVKRDQGLLAEAQVNIEKSIAILESIRNSVTSPELRASFLASLFEYYEFYADLLMRLHNVKPAEGYDQAALAFTEKVKLRSLVELLTNARVDLRQGVDAALINEERSLSERLTARLDDLTKLLQGQHTEAQKLAAERTIETLKDEHRKVQIQIRERSPQYAALTEPQPLGVREIQQQLLDDKTILLEYELGNERSYLWAVTVDGFTSYQLPPRAEVEAQARRVYELLIARQPAPNTTPAQQRAREVAADSQYLKQATILSDMLLKPVASQLGTKRLLIVADGALQYLPFGVLPAPVTQQTVSKPLIVDHEIVNLPSASVLAALRRELAQRQPAPKMVAVLADPVFDSNDARVKMSLAANKKRNDAPNAEDQAELKHALSSVRGEAGNLKRLLFSRDEAEAILSAVTPQKSGLKALDFSASRKMAMSNELDQYRIIHFSTHGLLDSHHPELSGLVLSLVDESGQPQQGFLRLHEIYNMKLNADLVVLSACQTGLGKEVKGEGLIGLVRGFMYAGSPRVMASLWQVDDAATAALMKRFYRGMLQEKLPPATALRAAQIEMIKNRHWQSPYYWGAFVLQGEWK